MRVSFIIVLVSLLFVFSGCEKKDDKKSVAAGMKCGAGKCGANMFDGNSALDKKKKNILSQMREDDSRKTCVINAKTTKELYDCVREKEGKKLTTKCGDTKPQPTMKADSTMKCAPGKCV
jgi:hypothetical protein